MQRIARSLVSLVSLATLASCGRGTTRLGPIVVASGAGDDLPFVVRQVTGANEGGDAVLLPLYLVHRTATGWRSRANELGEGDQATSDVPHYALAAAGDGRLVLAVATRTSGLSVLVRGDGALAAAELAPTLPAAAAADLQDVVPAPRPLAAWSGADAVVRVLTADWLYEIEDSLVARALPIAPQRRVSAFSPTGDRAGAGVEVATRTSLLELACDAAACTWSDDAGSDLGTADAGGSSSEWTRVLLHTPAGRPVYVRPVAPAAGDKRNAVLASWPGDSTTLFERNVYAIGAAPRVTQGFVVAAVTYGGTLSLVSVDDDGAVRPVPLTIGNLELAYVAQRIGLHVRTDLDGRERAHVFVGTASDVVTHVAVDLESETFTSERISVQQ
jgi:hypothetical protein